MEDPVNSPASVNGRMENRTLRERVYEVLRDEILSGHLGPGAELSEVALAERLGVSRGPIREALSLLCAQRLVTMQPRRGAYVSVLTRQEFLEAYQVREALEALAARLASARLQDDDIVALEALHEEMRRAVRDRAVQRFFDANQRFHLSLVALSGNGRLIEMHDQLVQRMGRYMARSLSLRGNLERSLAEHEEIIDALRARDATRAVAAVSLHIQVPQTSMAQIPDEIFASMDSATDAVTATGTAASAAAATRRRAAAD
jgi:DNA-binding GntR family transcriptional regulator